MNTNPLMKYFRQPGIHVKLPSGGNYNFKGEIELTSTDEVAIYPMTAADEITLSNPDSLLNGTALTRIILSCCPAIKNANTLTVPDVDVVILASKKVSYGDDLKLVGKCPKCSIAKEFTLSIGNLLNAVVPLPESMPVRLNDDLVAYLRPYTLDSNNRINLTQFEENKIIQNLLSQDISEEQRSLALTASFEKVTSLNLKLLSSSVLRISTPDSMVEDEDDIKEFLNNSSRETVKKIKEGIEEFNKFGLPKETELTCENKECNHTWKTPIVYDPSSFFVSDS